MLVLLRLSPDQFHRKNCSTLESRVLKQDTKHPAGGESIKVQEFSTCRGMCTQFMLLSCSTCRHHEKCEDSVCTNCWNIQKAAPWIKLQAPGRYARKKRQKPFRMMKIIKSSIPVERLRRALLRKLELQPRTQRHGRARDSFFVYCFCLLI